MYPWNISIAEKMFFRLFRCCSH